MKRVSLLCTALCLLCASAFPQSVDTVIHPEVRVEAYRIANAIGTRQADTDTLLLHLTAHQDLATLLQLHGNVQVRSYGPGGIATFSMRGTTAAHTQVAWMGIPINDPMLGVSDLGAMPINGLGGIRLLAGAAAMPHHSGGIGGTIELVEKSRRDRDGISAEASGEWGAFGTYAAGAAFQWKKQKLSANSAFTYRTAANNFTYRDLAVISHPLKTMTHAQMTLWAISQNLVFRWNPNNSISAHFRFSQTDRELPATMLMSSTKETLWDRDIWLALRYRHIGKRSEFEATAAYIHGAQEYFGNDNYLYPYLYQASKNTIRYRVMLHQKLELKAGMDISSEHARSDTAYGNTTGVWRHWQALFASMTYSPVRWARIQALIREDLIDARFSPVQALGGAELDALKWLRLSANVSRNFRNPTLNDLYWSPGGNPQLKHETGFSAEAGITFHKKWPRSGIEVQADWFRTDVDNWILWNPSAGNIWSPQNMRQVLAQGAETRLKMYGTIGVVRLTLHTEYAYTSATIQQSDAANDNTVGKQLIYTPNHGIRSHISVNWKGLTVIYGHTWTGERFTSSDNKFLLPSYHIGWASANYRLPIQQHAIQLGLTVDNIYGEEYQTIAWRPMPSRSWRIILSYTIAVDDK